MGCLYKLESPSGKCYIGITSKTLDKRWKDHKQRVREGRNQALQCAIKKYGAENFKTQILVIANDWEYLCDLEKKAIAGYGTMSPHGYNLTIGGEGVIGRVHTEQASRNMSDGQKKRFQRPQERAKNIMASNKSKEAIRIKWKNYHNSQEIIKKRKEKERTKSIRCWDRDGYRELHSQRTKEGMARADVKIKLIAKAKERSQNPEWRKKYPHQKLVQL